MYHCYLVLRRIGDYISLDLFYFNRAVSESRGGRPGLSVLMSLLVSVDVKQH